jgi:ATP-dependent DNA ligase
MLRWPVRPVSATPARRLPESRRIPLAYEMKWDGFRAIIWRTDDGIRVQSRRGVDLTAVFPDLVEPLTAVLPPRAVIDGEIIVWDSVRGRCDFSSLQRRLIAGRALDQQIRRHPVHYVAFDLLRDGGGAELVDQPLSQRRGKLERLLAGAPAQIAVCPQTGSLAVAQDWMSQTAVAGIEGVVAKPVNGRYRPRRAGWTKTRARTTAEYVIGGITGSLARPASLLLGRLDGGQVLRYLGQTHPITADQRRELTEVLRGMTFQGDGSGHPWPCPLPASWSAGRPGSPPLTYIPVEPTVVAEVEVDTALDGTLGKIRHGCRYVRTRLDLRPDDIRVIASGTSSPTNRLADDVAALT